MQPKTRFYFDGHLHVPPERVEETVAMAINRGLDALFFTDYGTTANFDYLAFNCDQEGNKILTPNQWEIQLESPTVLQLYNEQGNVSILKAEEVRTKQGHLLAWGIETTIESSLGIENAFKKISRQGGIGVFPHLLVNSFEGCGKDVFDQMFHRFKDYPLGVEKNGQIAWIWDKVFGSNRKVGELAEEYGIACFGNSDIHGHYRKEHQKVGKKYYSSVPRDYIDSKKLTESLAEVMRFHPREIKIEGNTNSLLETVLWNLSSVRMNGRKKIKELAQGFNHLRKRKT